MPNSSIIVNYSNISLYSNKKLIYATGPMKIKFSNISLYKNIGIFNVENSNVTSIIFNINNAELYLNNKSYVLSIFNKNASTNLCCYDKNSSGIIINTVPIFIQIYGGIKNYFYYYQMVNSSFYYNNTRSNYTILNATKFNNSIKMNNSTFKYNNNNLTFSFNLINKLGIKLNITEIRIFGAMYFNQSSVYINNTRTYYNTSSSKQNNTNMKNKYGKNLLMPIVFGGQIRGIGPNTTTTYYKNTTISSDILNSSSFNKYYRGMLNFIVETNGTLLLPTYQNSLYNIGYLSKNKTLHFSYNNRVVLDNFTCKSYTTLNCSLIEPETLGLIANSNYTLLVYSNYSIIGNITERLND